MKTKLTAEVREKILENLRAGAFRKHAALAADVPERTLIRWLEMGRAGEEPYAAFAHECEVAIAMDAVRNQALISRAASGAFQGDWRAAAWNLERKHPKLYGRTAEHRELLPPPAEEKPRSPWLLTPQPDAVAANTTNTNTPTH